MRQKVRKIMGIIACSWLAMSPMVSEAAFPDSQNPYSLANGRFYPLSSLTLPDGRRLFSGTLSSLTYPWNYSFAVARFNSDGTPDASFNGTGLAVVPIWGYYEFLGLLAIQPDGRIIAAGNAADPVLGPLNERCYPAFCNTYPALIRLNPDGSVDRSFNGTGRLVISIGEDLAPDDCCGALTGLELQADGKILVFSERKASARVNADGTLDRSFVGTDLVAVEVHPPPLVALGAGFTGTWFDPAQGDQGFMLEVLSGTPMQLLATWFTFAPQGGAAWIFGLGAISGGGTTTMLGIQAAGAGARFPPNLDATNVQTVPWGTLTFRFTDCNHGHVAWSSSVAGYGSGAMELTRLTLPAGVSCSQ